MKRLKQFLRLNPADRGRFLEAVSVAALIKVFLNLFPFPTARRMIQNFVSARRRASPPEQSPKEINKILWAVRAARHMPGLGNCLVQALTGRILLQRRGIPSDLRIGVAKKNGERLDAHAWLECGGAVVLGGSMPADIQAFDPTIPL